MRPAGGLSASLDRCKRLTDGAGTVGTVPVETTVAGIRALAESDRVQAILEDQKLVFHPERAAS